MLQTTTRTHKSKAPAPARRAIAKFRAFYPGGFDDEDYVELERSYKARAHEQWTRALDRKRFAELLRDERYEEIAAEAVRIESRTNLLFSFEKMALRDAVKTQAGAQTFARGLYDFVTARQPSLDAFERWVAAVESLPRRQTRVLTWPIVTVFGFIARPDIHMYLKPTVTKIAAREYGFEFEYRSRPNWRTYESLLEFAAAVHADTRELRPRDMIDVQSFIWVQGSDEYEE